MSPTGNLYGGVLDAQGHSISGATVTATGPGAAQKASTDANGDFHFLYLSPGTYSVRLERTGFEAVHREVSIAPGKSAVLSITMPVAGATEAVTVHGDMPLDNRKIRTGATYDEKELESIPTTRDPWAILRQTPGVLLANMNVGGGRHPRQSSFVGKGARSNQNSYNLDGIAISRGGVSPLYYDFDSFSSIEVATGGSDPSLSTPGVTLNLVTKRGTNELMGAARALYTGGAGWDYGIGLGGPLWRDRVWLWGEAAQDAFLGQTSFAAGEPVDNRETLKHWNAKLNAEMIPANALTVSYTNFGRVSTGLGAAPDRSLPTTVSNNLESQALRVADSQVVSPTFLAALSLSYVNGTAKGTPLGGLDEQSDQDIGSVWRYSFQAWRLSEAQHQANLDSSVFFGTGNLRHELRFGFGYTHEFFDSASSWPGDQLLGLAPLGWAGITRLQNSKSEVNDYAAFVADTILAGRLTINVGARFEYQQGKNLPSRVPANPAFPDLLPAVSYAGDTGYPITWRAIQPRLGATYSIGQDHKTLVRASYSRFANQLGNEVRSINSFPTIAVSYYGWNDTNANGRVEPGEVDLSNYQISFGFNPNNPGSSTPVNQISRSFKPPTTDEFIVGIDRQISPGISGSLAYTYRIARNLEFSPLIGTTRSSYQYFGNATGTAVASDGFVLSFNEPYYGLTDCPDPCAGTVLENRPDSNETYSGIELQLVKAFSHGWMARVSFAYNDWQQHIGPGGIVNPNNEVPGTNASGPVVAGGINATWAFNVSGSVNLPLGISAGVNLFGRQGFPISYGVQVLMPDLALPPLIQIGTATQYRTPNVYQLDLQLARAFRIGPAVTVIPQVACFNVLDSHTVLQRDGNAGQYDATVSPAVVTYYPDQFNAPATLSNRVIRGGVRVTF